MTKYNFDLENKLNTKLKQSGIFYEIFNDFVKVFSLNLCNVYSKEYYTIEDNSIIRISDNFKVQNLY